MWKCLPGFNFNFFKNIIPKNLLCDKMENGKMWHVTILRIYRYASSKIIYEYNEIIPPKFEYLNEDT